MTDTPDHLAMITAALDAANNPRLGTDTRLRHALTACGYLAKLAAYQEERLRYLAAEIYLLRDVGARV
jgi:hypothetical protein